MTSTEEIAATLRSIAKPGMKPKAIRAAIWERHPDASKKDVVRAAFFAVTESAASQEATSELHNFALAERVAEENADAVLRLGKRKKRSAPPPLPRDRRRIEATRLSRRSVRLRGRPHRS